MNSLNKFHKYNKLHIGIIAAILIPVVFYFIMYNRSLRDIGWTIFFNTRVASNIIPILLSHCILPNIVLFFVFNGINWMRAAKGVIVTTVILTVCLLLLKLVLFLI